MPDKPDDKESNKSTDDQRLQVARKGLLRWISRNEEQRQNEARALTAIRQST